MGRSRCKREYKYRLLPIPSVSSWIFGIAQPKPIRGYGRVNEGGKRDRARDREGIIERIKVYYINNSNHEHIVATWNSIGIYVCIRIAYPLHRTATIYRHVFLKLSLLLMHTLVPPVSLCWVCVAECTTTATYSSIPIHIHEDFSWQRGKSIIKNKNALIQRKVKRLSCTNARVLGFGCRFNFLVALHTFLLRFIFVSRVYVFVVLFSIYFCVFFFVFIVIVFVLASVFLHQLQSFFWISFLFFLQSQISSEERMKEKKAFDINNYCFVGVGFSFNFVFLLLIYLCLCMST